MYPNFVSGMEDMIQQSRSQYGNMKTSLNQSLIIITLMVLFPDVRFHQQRQLTSILELPGNIWPSQDSTKDVVSTYTRLRRVYVHVGSDNPVLRRRKLEARHKYVDKNFDFNYRESHADAGLHVQILDGK